MLTERLRRRGKSGLSDARTNPYIPHEPTPQQAEFDNLPNKEALYGGAAGGGKSDALLMGALKYVGVPNYSAILFRKTFQDLALPEGLISRSHEWLAGTDARWDGQQHQWRWPQTNAKLAFGYLDNPMDKYRYQGAAFQYIGIDELTQHRLDDYLFMFSRLRATTNMDIPLRMRGASNPGGVGHRWVKRRFIDPVTKAPDAIYVPAKLKDNPHLRADYSDSLNYLDPVTKAQYLEGDWTVVDDNIFVFPEFDRATHAGERRPSNDPDFYPLRTVGVDPGTRDPYAVIVLGRTKEGAWWVLEEFYRTGGSTSRWQNEFWKMQLRWRVPRWWTDKRKPSDIQDLRNAGLPAVANLDIHGENERDTIRPMLVVPQSLMHDGRLFIDSRCEHTIAEFENYRYKEAEDKNAGEVPVDADNHAMDAIRYALCSTEGVYQGPSQWRRSGTDQSPRPPLPRAPYRAPTINESIAEQDKKLDKWELMKRDDRRGKYARI